MAKLLAGETDVEIKEDLSYTATSRTWASDVIILVGRCCEVGLYPKNVSAFDLGRALGRALVNSNEEDPAAELVRGLTHSKGNREQFYRALELPDGINRTDAPGRKGVAQLPGEGAQD